MAAAAILVRFYTEWASVWCRRRPRLSATIVPPLYRTHRCRRASRQQKKKIKRTTLYLNERDKARRMVPLPLPLRGVHCGGGCVTAAYVFSSRLLSNGWWCPSLPTLWQHFITHRRKYYYCFFFFLSRVCVCMRVRDHVRTRYLGRADDGVSTISKISKNRIKN